ncbi:MULTISPECIES: exosortase S [Arthrobacter]|uniref:Exosortase S n=2 Tax=Arthrobacter TaxID=1663 RepID=A0ABU9KLD5_9MICC|nr:exosortase S [Arthrobacter sp. YJM1]MDP5227707.1 exosortase S [Arthrobacter sp. YJM1]
MSSTVTSARRRAESRPAGLLPALICFALAGVVLYQQEAIRAGEARLMSAIFAVALPGGSYAVRDIVFFNLGTGHAYGIQVSPLCSSAVLMAPILAISGVLFLLRRIPVGRLFRAAVLAAALVVFSNLLRYFMIALAEVSWGQAGFDVVHHFVGSFLVILAFVLAVLLLVRSGRQTHSRAA